MPWADMIADNLELKAAIAACVGATVPNRGLDARISLAVFPGLGDLPRVGPGVWRQIDGTHARALRYSALQSAAATLVPPGCWIETHGREIHVHGESGAWVGIHGIQTIAICIAALKARLHEESGLHRLS